MSEKLGVKKSLTLEIAKQVAAAGEAEARKNNWNVVVAVVDDGGHLICLHRMDDTQYASSDVAVRKAQTAIAFKRPSKAFEDAVLAGRTVAMSLPIVSLEGGVPLVVDGKMIGAVGVSGVASQQDGVVAKAATDAFAKIIGV